MDRKGQDLLLGAVFFAALGTLLAATFYVSDVEALFVERPKLRVDFDEVGGLAPGNSVYIKGYRVGEVATLDYRPDARRVRATLLLQRQVTLFEGYSIRIEDGSVLGGKQIDIDPGTGEQRVSSESILEGTYVGGPFDGQRALAVRVLQAHPGDLDGGHIREDLLHRRRRRAGRFDGGVVCLAPVQHQQHHQAEKDNQQAEQAA